MLDEEKSKKLFEIGLNIIYSIQKQKFLKLENKEENAAINFIILCSCK